LQLLVVDHAVKLIGLYKLVMGTKIVFAVATCYPVVHDVSLIGLKLTINFVCSCCAVKLIGLCLDLTASEMFSYTWLRLSFAVTLGLFLSVKRCQVSALNLYEWFRFLS